VGPTDLLKVVTSLFKAKLPPELLEGSHTARLQRMIYAFEKEQDASLALGPKSKELQFKQVEGFYLF